jgi:alpha-aminoadipate carrier protein LysW
MPTAICPECDEEVYIDTERVQGDVVKCDECGSRLEIVGLDPIEVDLLTDAEIDDADEEDEDFESYDYENERF